MTFFSKLLEIMPNNGHRSHIRLYGLRIKCFESPRRYEYNGTPPDPHNWHINRFQQTSNGPHRPECTLNYSVNCVPAELDADIDVQRFQFKRAPPTAADPGGFPDFRIFFFWKALFF